jgi:hypothetical protein
VSKNILQSTNTVSNTQLAGGDIETGNLVYGDNNRIFTSDFGAIDRAADISAAALNLGNNAIDRGTAVSIQGLDSAQRQLQSSLDFADRAMERSYDAQGDAIQNAFEGGFGIAGDALDFGRNALNEVGQNNADALAFAQSVYQGNSGLVKASLEGNAELAKQVSQSSQQSLNDSVVKLAMIAAAAIACVYIFRS